MMLGGKEMEQADKNVSSCTKCRRVVGDNARTKTDVDWFDEIKTVRNITSRVQEEIERKQLHTRALNMLGEKL